MRMRPTTACVLLVTTCAVGGCREATVGPDGELAAPANQFVVTMGSGSQLTGPAARIDIRYVDAAQPPDVEIAFSASGNSGRTWSVLSAAPADFLQSLALTARVVDGRVGIGTASVQVSLDGKEANAAPGGLLSVRLYAGRLMGEASRMDDEFAARFEGPFVVTCAIPASLSAGDAPVSSGSGAPQTLTVDEHFESALCRPYATLAGR
jgi:hypothetical protein